MEYAKTCQSTTGNTGLSGCGVEVGRYTGLVLTPQKTEIASKSVVILEATWTAKFKALRNTRWFPMIVSDDYQPGENTTTYQAGANGDSTKLNTVMGTQVLEHFIDDNKMSEIEWQDFQRVANFGKKDGFIITEKGYIGGWQPDGTTKLKPFSLKLLEAESLTNRGKEMTQKGLLKFSLRNQYEWDRLKWVKPTAFDPNDFVGLINVEVAATTGAATATVAVIDVTVANTGIGISSLVAGDFTGTAVSGGAVITVSEVAESATVAGQYSLTYSTQAAGDYTFGLKVPSLMTTAGYEMTTAQATVTIPS